MPLYLVVHSVNTVTAKVAFSTILLQDFVVNKKVPAEFKCRQLIPTSGGKSTSLWDAADPDALLAWLTANIAVDCSHEYFEVQEDFGIGLGEVARARTTERVADGFNSGLHEVDTKLRISERAGLAAEVVRDSAVVQSTAAAFSKAGTSMKQAGAKVMDQPAVAAASEAVGSGLRKLGSGLSSLTGRVTNRRNSGGGGAPSDLGAGQGGAEVPAAGVLRPQDAPAFTLDDAEPGKK